MRTVFSQHEKERTKTTIRAMPNNLQAYSPISKKKKYTFQGKFYVNIKL